MVKTTGEVLRRSNNGGNEAAQDILRGDNSRSKRVSASVAKVLESKVRFRCLLYRTHISFHFKFYLENHNVRTNLIDFFVLTNRLKFKSLKFSEVTNIA